MIVTWALTVAVITGVNCRNKPVVEDVFWVTHAGPPDGAAAMLTEAAAVVLGDLRESTTVDRTVAGVLVLDTIHRFDIVEVIKFHPSLPDNGEGLRISAAGGEKELAESILRQTPANADPLVIGSRYVIFLAANVDNTLRTAWGLASIYDVTSSVVRSVERSESNLDRISRDGFLATLRAAAP